MRRILQPFCKKIISQAIPPNEREEQEKMKVNLTAKEAELITIGLTEYCLAKTHCGNCIFFFEDGEPCKQVPILHKLENPAE